MISINILLYKIYFLPVEAIIIIKKTEDAGISKAEADFRFSLSKLFVAVLAVFSAPSVASALSGVKSNNYNTSLVNHTIPAYPLSDHVAASLISNNSTNHTAASTKPATNRRTQRYKPAPQRKTATYTDITQHPDFKKKVDACEAVFKEAVAATEVTVPTIKQRKLLEIINTHTLPGKESFIIFDSRAPENAKLIQSFILSEHSIKELQRLSGTPTVQNPAPIVDLSQSFNPELDQIKRTYGNRFITLSKNSVGKYQGAMMFEIMILEPQPAFRLWNHRMQESILTKD